MRDKIIKLERQSASLEPGQEEREILRRPVMDYTDDFLNHIETIKAYQKSETPSVNISEFEPDKQTYSMEQIVHILSQSMDKEGLNPASGGHLGYIPGGGIYASSIADYWAAITNRYAGVFYASPDAVRIENKLIQWLGKIIGYPEGMHGNLTSGGSVANLIGMITARKAMGIKAGHIPNSTIYLTRQAHHSIIKSFSVSGIDECHIRYIELDDHFRMDMNDLRNKISEDSKKGLQPFLLVGSAGTTDVGAIDPMDEMADIAEEYNMWLHIDAAYGGFFILLDEFKSKFKGIERSDSVVIDPHKGLFLPYGLGVCLVKNGQHIQQAFTFKANYLQDIDSMKDEINPMDASPEMTKHFRGLRLWIPIMLYGLDPFRAALQEKIMLARYFYSQLKEMKDWDVGQYPQLSIVTFRYQPTSENHDRENQFILDKVREDGRVFISSTNIDGKFTLRLAILSFRTHLRTLDIMLEILRDSVKLIEENKIKIS